jgi:hypothetical protein
MLWNSFASPSDSPDNEAGVVISAIFYLLVIFAMT